MGDPQAVTGWKKVAVQSLFTGLGIAIGLSVIGAAGLWYASRSELPKLWNVHAIVAQGPPSFSTGSWVSKDGKTTLPTVELDYTVENTTGKDYTIDSKTAIKFTLRLSDGSISPNLLSGETDANEQYQDDVSLPFFVPARQKAILPIHFADKDLPSKGAIESGSDYHERIRSYLNKTYGLSGLVIFDSVNRFEIDLPRWSPKRPG